MSLYFKAVALRLLLSFYYIVVKTVFNKVIKALDF